MNSKDFKQYSGIMVYGRINEEGPSEGLLELLGEANRLKGQMAVGSKVTAACLGTSIERHLTTLYTYGADHICYIEDSRLEFYRPDIYADGMEALIRAEKPEILLVSADIEGGEIASTVAARLGTGLAAHCVEFRFDGDEFVQVVPAFAGKIFGDIMTPETRPQMATVKPGMFSKMEQDEEKKGTAARVELTSEGFGDRIKLISAEMPEKQDRKTVCDSCFVIGGGLGVGGKENWQLLEELGELMDGAVGSTRPALDLNWTEDDKSMIGTSGQIIKPNMYISVGISGAAHHTCGVKDAGVSIAINNDSSASIFSESDYAICDDWKNIIPLLIEKLKARRK